MKRWHIISVLLCSYVFFMIAGIPASRALAYVQTTTPLPFKLQGVTGSIWHGQAERITLTGRHRLDDLQWSVNPFGLLLARLSTGIEATLEKQPVQGRVNYHLFSGDVIFHNVTTRLHAKTLQKLADIPFGELGGEFEVHLDHVTLHEDLLPQVDAHAYWQNASLTLDTTISLGQVDITLASDEAKQSKITLSNQGGDLSISGTIHVGTDRGYVLDISLKPRDATGDVAQSLSLFAQRQADGSYRIKQNGNLRQLGF